MSSLRVGGEVDGFCSRCKMVLAHTIIAMVGERIARARCNTCQGEHAFKAAAPTSGKPAGARPRAASAATHSRAQVVSFDDLLAGKDTASAKRYLPITKFTLGDVVDHPTFGLGVVGTARPDKIDVTFRSFVKTLVHNRPAPARPGLAPVAAESKDPGDAPSA